MSRRPPSHISPPAGPGSSPRRYWDPRDDCWHTQITQGEAYVTAEENEVISTVLGSCVAACIRDPVARIGGMNHFLLPDGDGSGDVMRYGVYSMELLINGILGRGAARERLQAKLFGGANVIAALSGIGTRNADFAEHFLMDEGIHIVGGDLRGTSPRRVQYWPWTGRARQLSISTDARELVQQELKEARHELEVVEEKNDVELF